MDIAPRLDQPVLPADPSYPYTVVIPTVGRSAVVPESYRLLRDRVPEGTRIVLSVNPVDREDAERTVAMIESMGAPYGGALDVIWSDGPISFGPAFNRGLVYAATTGGVGEVIVCYNDDLLATPGWLESLAAALTADTINLVSDNPGPRGRAPRDRAQWGRAGIAGPITTAAAGVQGFADREGVARLGHDGFAEWWRGTFDNPEYLSSRFMSGFCVALSRECAQDLLVPSPLSGFGVFAEEPYPVAGYEDNDLCVRARDAGWGAVVDWSNYIGHLGHQTFDTLFPEAERGMRNRAAYYEAWKPVTQRVDQRLVAIYRVRIGSVHDMHLFRASLTRHASIVDGVAVLLTNNPIRDMPAYPDWNSRVQLGAMEVDLLTALAGTMSTDAENGEPPRFQDVDDLNVLRGLMKSWVRAVVATAPETRSPDVELNLWTDDFNERDERNHAIAMGEAMNPDWLLSIDSDEVIEDRIRRSHFDRWMTHPDPLVEQYDFAWLDHWNDAKHYRVDPPWGDNGSGVGARHGRRLWRANKSWEQRILGGTANGLHCGNVPDTGAGSARACGGRWRHFGYVRQLDRLERYEKYRKLDPDPNPLMIGGATYEHIVNAEGMRIDFYNPRNGIGLHMLTYSGEDPRRIAATLDSLYALVDHVVLVWTDDAPPDAPASEGGMSNEMRLYVELFKCDVIHCPLRDEGGVNFANARNAGINHLQAWDAATTAGLGWGLYLDPDEQFGTDPLRCAISLRRMAETTTSWGWLIRFRNPLRSGVVTPSESLRMHKLDPQMRMRGRVHESFDAVTRAIVESGQSPGHRYAPFDMMNPGLAAENVNEKLALYADGLMAELTDNPENGGAWNSLGLQLEVEGRIDEALTCYRAAVAANPSSFIGYRSMMVHHLRVALALAAECHDRLSPAHDWYPYAAKIIEFLQEVASPAENPATKPLLGDLVLPALPRALQGPALGQDEAGALASDLADVFDADIPTDEPGADVYDADVPTAAEASPGA